MSCIDCLEKCNGIVTPDKCVQYTGPDRELFGICQGDYLFEVEDVIFDTLETLMNGTGTIVTGLVGCSFINNILLLQSPTVPVLFQTLFTATCSLKAQVDVLAAQISPVYTFNVSCLTGVTATSTRDQILQATITKVCSIDARLAIIEADYVKNSDLCTLVQACISGSGAGSEYNLRMVPYAPIPYIGSLSNFDNTGKGIVAAGFDKIYLMNGLNGTQDWRGRSPIGAIQNVPGGVLDPAVDPTLPANTGTNYVLNQKVGASSVTLTVPQMPSHTHTVLDPGHTHNTSLTSETRPCGTSCAPVSRPGGSSVTSASLTGIALNSTGGGLAHTNLQPSAACYYIVYIP